MVRESCCFHFRLGKMGESSGKGGASVGEVWEKGETSLTYEKPMPDLYPGKGG